jgi:hypothetical protein
MSDEQNFPWLNEIGNGSTADSQVQGEEPCDFNMEIEYDSVEQEGQANLPLDLLYDVPPLHSINAAAHDTGFLTSIVDEDSDDVMDIDEDDVPSPPSIQPSSSYEVPTATIPSLDEYSAQEFADTMPAFNVEPFSESSSAYSRYALSSINEMK